MPSWNKWTLSNILIAICVLIFIVMTFAGGSENIYVLLQFGAMQNQLVAEGEIWRLITANFLHIGFFHLLMNMVIYYQFGNLLESVLKRWQYVAVILVAMVTTTLATYLFSGNGTVSAGWSGVLFGVMGAFIALALIFPKRYQQYSKQIILPILILNVVVGFINPAVNWIGHFGGFIGGFAMMGIIALLIKAKKTD